MASMMQHFSFGLNSPATQPLKTAQKCVFIGFCLMAIIDCFYVSWAINGDDIKSGRTTGSDYSAALHWLSKYKNKRP